jgi:Outer membrane lipoprotein-sorting protein
MRHHRIARIVPLLLLGASLGLGLLPSLPEASAGPSARDIMEKFTLSRKAEGSESLVTMTVIEPGGEKRERTISIATKLFDKGETEKRLYNFTSPPDVKGTGILVFDNATKADDVWIFLPALRKTRRIQGQEKSKSFMGSDFTYGDLNIPELNDFDFSIAKEEDVGDDKCWVIDLVPKSKAIAESDGYSKKTYWVSQKTYAVRKGDFFDKDGKLLKQLKTDNIKLLDPKKQRYRIMRMEMINKKTGRRSVFETTKIAFTPDTKDDYFTTRYLERS